MISTTDPKEIPFESGACRLLEDLYEDHGDTIALQYGGSQLVNRIQTYRKSSPWTTHSRDILNSVSRYYSNSFTDAEKQMAINIFLGNYIPDEGKKDLWLLETDHYLHFQPIEAKDALPVPNYVTWWSKDLNGAFLACVYSCELVCVCVSCLYSPHPNPLLQPLRRSTCSAVGHASRGQSSSGRGASKTAKQLPASWQATST